MTMSDEYEAMYARVYLGLREGRLVADDVVTLACYLVDWSVNVCDDPAVTEVVERDPATVPPEEMAVLAQRILDSTDFEPGLDLAPEGADVLREALALAARDLPEAWTAAGPPSIHIDLDCYPVWARVLFADGWMHGEGMPAGPRDALADALVTVGEHLTESVTERYWTVWPVCPEHRLGVHAATSARDGAAVWLCNGEPGGHAVARIGHLNSR
jgi:hypothetical protein